MFTHFTLGPHAGEMMMSVLWYYRPEQTEMGKQPHIHGEVNVIKSHFKYTPWFCRLNVLREHNIWHFFTAIQFNPCVNASQVIFFILLQNEILASRHKDDNSVACIVDKCYVLSYPEYCR